MDNVSSRIKRFIDIAYEEALKSNGVQKIGAILVRGGKIVSRGHNSYFNGRHAEDACLSSLWKSEIQGCTLFVVRKRRNQVFGLSKPCKDCERLIRDARVKKVVFTTNENNIGILKV